MVVYRLIFLKKPTIIRGLLYFCGIMAIIGRDIYQAKAFLEQGNVVGIPTETVYGLAGNAFDIEAVTRIFEVKNRPTFDPLIVHTNSIERLSEFVPINSLLS